MGTKGGEAYSSFEAAIYSFETRHHTEREKEMFYFNMAILFDMDTEEQGLFILSRPNAVPDS